MDVLAAFADRQGIAFPLLSDEGSHAIRSLGLLNLHVQEDHAVYGVKPNPRVLGVPYPGTFLLDASGVIVAKRFHTSYRERDTGAGLIAETLGGASPAEGLEPPGVGAPVRVRAWLDSPTYGWFQRVHLRVEVAVAPGFHVYGHPAAEDRVGLSVTVVAMEGVQVGPARWPAPDRVPADGLDEEHGGHQGAVRGVLPLTFTGAPGAGRRAIHATVAFQARDASARLLPSPAPVELAIDEVGLVDRPLP